ncbi:MAG: PEP-CTERM sorting domain-containing protein [Alphaproteobacteria bacterium]
MGKFIVRVGLALVVGCVLGTTVAQAGFVEFKIGNQPFGSDTTKDFFRIWTWDFPQGAETWPPPAPDPAADDWPVTLNATAVGGGGAAAGTKNLTLNWRHQTGPHFNDKDPNGPFTITLAVPSPQAVNTKVVAKEVKVDHLLVGSAKKHTDFVYLSAQVGAGGNGVAASGIHLRDFPGFAASFENLFNKPVTMTIDASYANGPNQNVVKDQMVGAMATINLKIPGNPTDMVYTYSGSGNSQTTLAFLGGDPGAFEQFELGPSAALIMGTETFLVPLFIHETIDLFIGVDLVQWLALLPSLDPFQEVDFLDGTSDLLPGFIVGTSPVSFDPEFGFVTANPFTGRASIGAFADGRALVPEPATVGLLVMGLLGLGFARRARRRGTRPSGQAGWDGAR